jgi:hypothetical protein
MRFKVFPAVVLAFCLGVSAAWGADGIFPDPGALPAPGAMDLQALTPGMLEVREVDGRTGWDKPVTHWAALENPDFSINVPAATDFSVKVNGKPVGVAEVGFRREPIHAEYWRFDLRLLNALYLRLEAPLPEGARVEVADVAGKLWPADRPLRMEFSADRMSRLIHVNHAGYAPGFAKRAYVSGDFGNLGEMAVTPGTRAELLDGSGKAVFEAALELQNEKDWKWHQQVWQFDFSKVDAPGVYRIRVPGLGVSAPVRIHDAAFAAAARLHALGMFHQRSGYEKKLPFTRIEHAASHTLPAEIPTMDAKFQKTNRNIARMVEKNSGDKDGEGKNDEKPSAPPLVNVDASLFPFVNKGTVDVSGGHYDAGDYSKYMTNSSTLVSALVFAVDNFPGATDVDNLGIPESGDGIPDALQIAKWESDFIYKMQDADGGFYFLVYPRDRSYELDVLPENGDPQVVFPKTTVSTAAAVGALAQCAASPNFKKFYPDDAKRYLEAAKKGYAFLRAAIEKFGFEGSFQFISHYGKESGATDELCHAAAAMFAATGDKSYERDLMAWWPDPSGGQSTRWGWWPLNGSYGAAARIYAFVEQNGTLPKGSCDPGYLANMRRAVVSAGEMLSKLSVENAFGIPLSLASKRRAQAGWYWAMEFAFDFAAAAIATDDPQQRQAFLNVVLDCFGFEFGGNPTNRVFVSGAGPTWRRQVVNRISLNDSRKMAISGIAVGNVFSSPDNLAPYKIQGASGLRKMYFPTLADFPFYDRAGLDAYNVRGEFVTASTAKILATYLFLMGQTAEAKIPWKPPVVEIVGAPESVAAGKEFTASLRLPPPLTADDATVVWEVPGAEPFVGKSFRGSAGGSGPGRLEAEIVWPDGRRAFAVHKMNVTAGE